MDAKTDSKSDLAVNDRGKYKSK
uniref:Uncharacterized protein n=1 Tax=Arundo donax TaxID=35708 RepID=A0A0A9FTB3_ARUDO